MSNLNLLNIYFISLLCLFFYTSFYYHFNLTFDFIMNYIDIDLNDIGYALMVDVDYPVYLQPFDKSLLLLPEKRVINGNGIIKLVSTLYDITISYDKSLLLLPEKRVINGNGIIKLASTLYDITICKLNWSI